MRLIDAAGDMPKGSFEHRDAIFRKLGSLPSTHLSTPLATPATWPREGEWLLPLVLLPLPSPLSSSPLDASGADGAGGGGGGISGRRRTGPDRRGVGDPAGWSARSVSKVLRDPEVLRRPWPVVRAAAVAVARDGAWRLRGVCGMTGRGGTRLVFRRRRFGRSCRSSAVGVTRTGWSS